MSCPDESSLKLIFKNLRCKTPTKLRLLWEPSSITRGLTQIEADLNLEPLALTREGVLVFRPLACGFFSGVVVVAFREIKEEKREYCYVVVWRRRRPVTIMAEK